MIEPLKLERRGINFKDLTGKRFGRWIVLRFARKCPKTSRSFWLCRCDCGKEKAVFGGSLNRGVSVSCGCLTSELNKARLTTHGRTGTFEYTVWQNMINRCYNPKVKEYRFYGARGITVCRKWRESFSEFLADVGEAPPNTQLDRENNNRGYEPGNVRWTDKLTQANNTRSNRFIVLDGRRLTVAQWSRETGILSGTISARLEMGWSERRAVTEPPAFKSQTWRRRKATKSGTSALFQ